MKKYFILLLILLLIPSAFAAEKKVYSSWHYFQDEFIFQDSVYTVRLNRNDFEELRLQKDGESMVLNFDADTTDCEIKESYKYCYTKSSMNFKEKSSFDNEERQMPGVYIEIFNLYDKENIVIEKKLTPSKLHIGERGEITVTVKNEGEVDARNLRTQEIIPPGLRFISSSGIETRIGNELWSFYYLVAGREVSYSYTVEMQSFEDEEVETAISYEYTEGNVLNSSKILKVPITGFKASYGFSQKQINIEDTATYTVTLENEAVESDDIEVDLIVKFPSGLIVNPISQQITPKGFNEFEVKDTLLKERTNKYVFNVKSFVTGTYEAFSDLTIMNDGVWFSDNSTEKIIIGKGEITPYISVSPDVLRGGNEVTLFSYIESLSDKIIYDVKGSLSSDLFTEEFSLDSMAPGEVYDINKDKYISMPINQEEKKIAFVLNGTFETATGEAGSFQTIREVVVKPALESVTVNREFETLQMRKGEENKVRVTVSNQLGDAITDLVVKESFSKPVTIISGSTREEVNLQGKGTKASSAQAYIYNFKIPQNFPDTLLEVITEVSSEQKGYREIFVTPIIINLTEAGNIIDDNDDSTNNDNTDNNDDSDTSNNDNSNNDASNNDEESKGFWAKVGDFFKSLFARRE